MQNQNLHTHTLFCDGNDSPEDMILSAVKSGLSSLGFSSHSTTEFDRRYCLKNESEYIEEINRLKEKYRDKIKIYLGLEQDYYSAPPLDGYDYIIGSVHYLKLKDEYIPIDDDPEILKNAAEKYFSGDIISLCEEYFSTESKIRKKTNCDIIGHFDLITKFSDIRHDLIDFKSERYKDSMRSSLDCLLKTDCIFEVNTGAMSRGLKKAPYPSFDCLKRIYEKGGRVTISSDSHSFETVAFGFNETENILKHIGFKETYIYDGCGFIPQPLNIN